MLESVTQVKAGSPISRDIRRKCSVAGESTKWRTQFKEPECAPRSAVSASCEGHVLDFLILRQQSTFHVRHFFTCVPAGEVSECRDPKYS